MFVLQYVQSSMKSKIHKFHLDLWLGPDRKANPFEAWAGVYVARFDMKKFSMAVLRMFIIDFLALLINSVILWKFCSVNAVKGLCYLIRNYWSLITVTMGGAIVKVRLKLEILLGCISHIICNYSFLNINVLLHFST